jgi:hypothetical protein
LGCSKSGAKSGSKSGSVESPRTVMGAFKRPRLVEPVVLQRG